MTRRRLGRPTAAVTITLTAALVLAAAGCTGDATGEAVSAQDCTRQIRLGGVHYVGRGFTDLPASRFATAAEGDCEDVGPDARGVVFPEDPRQVAVWSFEGLPPEEVLGVRFDADSFAVFVSDTLSRRETARILRELGRPDA